MTSESIAAGANPPALDDQARIALIERIFINFPRLNRVVEKIAYCHQHSKVAAEPECLLITGQTGAGKTTLCQNYSGRFPRQSTRTGICAPVLSASIPVPATVKSLVTRLLLALGDPMPERGSIVSQTLRLFGLVRECQVDLVVLDELQHFIDRDSNVILTTVSNWLKDVLNETGIPMILTGLPHSEVILQANAQLERRFQMRESLTPFGWKQAEQQIEFRTFLKYLDESLPLAGRSRLNDAETALRIYCATGGVIGYVMKLVRRAAILAITRSAGSIDCSLLAEVYDERLSSSRPGPNPFRVDPERLQSALMEGTAENRTIAKADPLSRDASERRKAKYRA
jgi:energy-coupling factor transporter ATP-binding protein EcfA2